eukprot:11119899-Ditylum_brightwellii.AAC.1
MASSSSDESINSTKLLGLGKRAPSGSANLEKFLHILESDLLELDHHYKQVPLQGKDKELVGLFRQLKDENVVVIPTDKTNNYVTVTLNKFHSWVTKHLDKNVVEMKRKDI